MQTYDSSSAALVAGLLAVLMIPLIILSIILVISHWKIFEKAGKPGWASIVPIYNVIVFLEIIGKPTWWILLLMIPCTTLIFGIWATNLLSKSFGQSEGFTVGLIFLPFIFYPMLAFSNSYKYIGPAGAGVANSFDPSINYKNPFGNQNPNQDQNQNPPQV